MSITAITGITDKDLFKRHPNRLQIINGGLYAPVIRAAIRVEIGMMRQLGSPRRTKEVVGH